MKQAFVFLATGFEEIEALGTVDILRRGGIHVNTVSIMDKLEVVGAHNIPTIADFLFENADFSAADVLVIPGGIPGSNHLNSCCRLKELIVQKYKENILLAAICAGPMVLGGLGLLKGRNATCFPNFEPTMIGATAIDAGVVVDGNIITCKGPGYVFDFGIAILKVLKDEMIAEEVAAALLMKTDC